MKLLYNIQNSPQLKREANTKFPSQPCKSCLIEGFGEDIRKLVLSGHMPQLDVAFLVVITQKVKTHIDMLGF